MTDDRKPNWLLEAIQSQRQTRKRRPAWTDRFFENDNDDDTPQDAA